MRVNPFNYSKPIDGNRLQGRPEECSQIGYLVREAALGNLMNLAILGRSQIGKSSLLNYFSAKAQESGIITIDISPWEYSRGDINSTINTVLRKLMSKLEEFFQFGLDVGVDSNEESNDSIDHIHLENEVMNVLVDSEDLLAPVQAIFGRNPALRAVLTLDDIGNSDNDLQILKNLLWLSEKLPVFIAIAANEQILAENGGTQEVISHFTKIRIGPFESASQTWEVVEEAVQFASEPDEAIDINPDAIEDIHILSGGHPREINLIGYHISQAYNEGTVEKFEITSDVLDVIMSQFDDAYPQDLIDTVRKLNNDEMEQLTQLVRQEGLNVRDMALLKLAFVSYSAEELHVQEGKITESVEKYLDLGLIEKSGKSFRLKGSEWSKVYVAYRYLKQLGKPCSLPRARLTPYARLLIQSLADHLNSSAPPPLAISSIGLKSAVTGFTDEFDRVLGYLDKRDPVPLMRSTYYLPLMHFTTHDSTRREVLITIFEFVCETTNEDYFIRFISTNTKEDSTNEIAMQNMVEYVESLETLFTTYGIRLKNVKQSNLSQDEHSKFLNITVAYTDIVRTWKSFDSAFERADYDSAEQIANINFQKAHILSEETILEWSLKRSFVQICNGHGLESLQALNEAASSTEPGIIPTLAKVDLAYIHMCQGENDKTEILLREVLVSLQQSTEKHDVTLKIGFGKNDLLRPANGDQSYDLLPSVEIQPVVDCMLGIILANRDNIRGALFRIQRAKRRARGKSYPFRVEARIRALNGEHELARQALIRAKNIEPTEDIIDLELMALSDMLKETK